MEIVWLLIGLVIGLLVAWFFLRARHRQELAKREAELMQENRQANEDLERRRAAHDTTKQRLSEAEAKEASAVERGESLEGDLNAGREALERERDAHEKTKQRLSEAQAKEASAVERGVSLEADLNAGREALERVTAADDEKRTKLSQQQSAIDDLKARLSTAENARVELDEQLKEAQAERRAADDDGRSQIADLQTRVRERDEKIAGLEAELAARPATAASPTRPTSAPAAELRSEAPALYDAAALASGPPDDLTRIKGIGPTLKDKLYGLGITSFQQIAEFTPSDIARVNDVLDFPGRIEREQWVEQAKAIVDR